MWIRARTAVARWLAPEVPPPPLTPAERVERAVSAAQRDWAARLERVAEERRQMAAARAVAEQEARAAEVVRRRLAHEQFLEICAQNHGWWFPGDRLTGPSDFIGRWRRDGLLGRVLAMLGLGG